MTGACVERLLEENAATPRIREVWYHPSQNLMRPRELYSRSCPSNPSPFPLWVDSENPSILQREDHSQVKSFRPYPVAHC